MYMGSQEMLEVLERDNFTINQNLGKVGNIQYIFNVYCDLVGIYSAFGKYSDPFTSSTFCYLSLILKLIKSFFSVINLHKIPHIDKARTESFQINLK